MPGRMFMKIILSPVIIAHLHHYLFAMDIRYMREHFTTLNSLSPIHGMEHTQIGPTMFNTSECSAFIIEYRGSIQLCLKCENKTIRYC